MPTVTIARRGALLAVVAAAAVLGSAGAAAAEPSSRASCMGHEASAISPPGSSNEFPGGMPQLRAFIDELAPGTPPGVVYRTFAHLHEGTHEACDEAIAGGG